jgi:hypothetical protein
MRTAILLVPLAAAAVLAPLAVWYRPVSAPAAETDEVERPDTVLAAQYVDQLPFGCRRTSFCCGNHEEIAILVDQSALWVGSKAIGAPRRVARDGREWEVLAANLRDLDPWGDFPDVQIAVHDGATYEDLLAAMLSAQSVGARPRVIQPALPAYPNHGWRSGMEL